MSDPNGPTNANEKDPLLHAEGSSESESDSEHEHEQKERISKVSTADSDERFRQPTPSPYKRGALILFTLILFWLALSMRKSLWEVNKSPKVIHASRYSKEHKFRPAASPIITETLKDGRVRVRGAGPTQTPKPTPKTSPGKVKVGRKGTKGGKKGKKKLATTKRK